MDEDFTGAPNRIDNRLSTVAGIKYRTLKKIDPEDPTKEIQIPDTSDNIYVSFGLMEDIIFNQELAVASTYQSDDAVNFKLEFDSSNSFTTYDTNLKKMIC